MLISPRERVLTALAREKPDRCPMQISFTPEFARRLREDLRLGGRLEHNPHGGGNTYELELALGEDMLLTSVGWANSYYQADRSYTDEWGIRWDNIEYQTQFGTGRYTEMTGYPLADSNAVESYRPPDPNRPELYERTEWTLREFQKEYWIVGVAVTTIWETAWALRGFERLLTDLVTDPGLADRILDIPYRYHLAVAKKMAAMGVDMIWLGDDVGTQSGMLISPVQWRRFLKPLLANLIAEVKSTRPGIRIAYHSDGDVRTIIPELIDIGVDILNPIQPACMDPAEIKRKYGHRLSFWGTIDEQHTLPFGTAEDVAGEVRRRVETVGYDGGLIIGPTHHVQLDTPLENFWAMVRAIKGS